MQGETKHTLFFALELELGKICKDGPVGFVGSSDACGDQILNSYKIVIF